MTTIDELDINSALRSSTLEFANANAERLDQRLATGMATWTREVRSLKGAPGLIVRRNFAQAKPVWEKFFWARVGQHHVRESAPLEMALKLADEDLIGLSAVIDPL